MPNPTPQQLAEIKQRLATRALCRRRLLPFVLNNVKGYEPGWIHKEICQKLEKFEQDVIDKKSPRLMLFMPPRHGKSELASTQFPGWFLGRNPDKEVIATSYASTLALSFSRKVRELIRSPGYNTLFPKTKLVKDSQSTENWLTTEGGGYLAAGVGGPITGKGADALIIDDPVKNRADAESATERQRVWDWYSSTAYTRLMPGGGVLLILTRWHQDDLAGRLLYEMQHGGDKWDIIVYPAIAVHKERYREEGEPLNPERYDLEALARIKGALTKRDWGALYQQSPSTEEGSIIKRQDWNRWLDEEPPNCTYIIQSLDTAFDNKSTADYSVITTWGLFYPQGRYPDAELQLTNYDDDHQFDGTDAHLILLDVVRERYSFTELKREAFRLQQHWKPDATTG